MKEIMAKGKFLQLCREDRWEWCERVRCSGVVVIVALTNEKKMLFVEQFRMGLKKAVIEFPAGLAGDEVEGESLEAAAERELWEETGYRAERWERLTEGPPSAGLSPEAVTLFRAHGLKREGPGGGDAHENLTVHEVPLAEVERWLETQGRSGKAVDPKIYAGLYFLRK